MLLIWSCASCLHFIIERWAHDSACIDGETSSGNSITNELVTVGSCSCHKHVMKHLLHPIHYSSISLNQLLHSNLAILPLKITQISPKEVQILEPHKCFSCFIAFHLAISFTEGSWSSFTSPCRFAMPDSNTLMDAVSSRSCTKASRVWLFKCKTGLNTKTKSDCLRNVTLRRDVNIV